MTTITQTRGAVRARWPDLALLGLRFAVALVFLYHGLPKALQIDMAMEKFVGFGLPGTLGPVVGWLEVVAGIALAVGIFTRAASLLLVAIILVALIVVQAPGGFTAGFERDLLLLAALVVLAATGAGRYSADHHRAAPEDAH